MVRYRLAPVLHSARACLPPPVTRKGAPPESGCRAGLICTQAPTRGRRVARAAQQPSPERAAPNTQHDPGTPSHAPVRPRPGTTCRWQSAVSVVRAQPVPRSAGARLPRRGKANPPACLRYCTRRCCGSPACVQPPARTHHTRRTGSTLLRRAFVTKPAHTRPTPVVYHKRRAARIACSASGSRLSATRPER